LIEINEIQDEDSNAVTLNVERAAMPKILTIKILAHVFGVGLICFFFGVLVAQSSVKAMKSGKADFVTYCAACHGTGAKGDGTVAEFLTLSATDLTQLKKRNADVFPRARVVEVIDGRADVKVHGPRDMPVWGDWFKYEADASKKGKGAKEDVIRSRIEALADYIEFIQEK
jgi:Cytochrome C oxidase, cbb3-type, subunit III